MKTIVTKASQILLLDRLSERIGLVQILKRGGIGESFSRLMSKLAYWVVLISFIIMGLDALKIPAVENLLREF